MLLLEENFNLLFFGLGSKRSLLSEFHTTMLADRNVVVVNGFFPSLTVKQILTGITSELVAIFKKKLSSQLTVRYNKLECLSESIVIFSRRPKPCPSGTPYVAQLNALTLPDKHVDIAWNVLALLVGLLSTFRFARNQHSSLKFCTVSIEEKIVTMSDNRSRPRSPSVHPPNK
jgi:hypothetical protein